MVIYMVYLGGVIVKRDVYRLYLNGSFYGGGDSDYMLELIDDWLLMMSTCNQDQVKLEIKKVNS